MFKIGDEVRYTQVGNTKLQKGSIYTVSAIHYSTYDEALGIHLVGFGGPDDWWYFERFKKVTLHKHSEMIKAWADGAEIQARDRHNWLDVKEPAWILDFEYRVKPEPQPDVVSYVHMLLGGASKTVPQIHISCNHNWSETGQPTYSRPCNAKLTFDSETGELKAVEKI